MPTPTRSIDVLALLVRHRVDFIVVGMTAGVLQGAPAVTFDLDVLYARAPDNVARLLEALEELSATFRADARGIRPNESHLLTAVHKLLSTKYGLVDFLGAVDGRSYEELLEHTVTLPVESMVLEVLALEELIVVKERAGREKDLAVLPLLRATLARAQRRT